MIIPALIRENKHIFGTYSAMALMNIRTVLNHIQKVANIDGQMPTNEKSGNEKEDYWLHPVILHLKESAINDKSTEKTECAIEKLNKALPFIKIMAQNQLEFFNKINQQNRNFITGRDIADILSLLLQVLKKYRDYTCHYRPSADDSWNDGSPFLNKEHRLSLIINKYYDIALREVKERYKYSTEQLAFIQHNRYRKNPRDTKRKIVTNYNFFLSMQSLNEDKTGQPHLSGIGVVQLISLFLEKKYINNFLSQIHINGDISTQSEEYKIIRRSLSIHSIALLKSDYNRTKRALL